MKDPQPHASSLTPPATAFSLLSLAAFSVLVLGYLWWGRISYYFRTWQAVAYLGAVLIVVVNHWFHRDDIREMGLRLDNAAKAAKVYGLPTLAVCLAIAVSAPLLNGEWRFPGWTTIAFYLPWTLVQQHLLHNFLRRRFQETLFWGAGWATACFSASLLFALYHLPNLALCAITFLGALFWTWTFVRVPNLLWAALSQTLLTMTLLAFFKFGFLNQLEVGLSGFRYQTYGDGVKVAAGYDALGDPFIATLPGPNAERSYWVRVFRPDGSQLYQWQAFPDLEFPGEISAGELGFGPGHEILVTAGPGPSSPPVVRLFNLEGSLLAEHRIEELNFGYGIWARTACGRLYLAPGPAPRAPQSVLEMSPSGRVTNSWSFPGVNFSNGLRVTAICSSHGSKPRYLLLWGTEVAVNRAQVFIYNTNNENLTSVNLLPTTFGAQITPLRIDGYQAIAAAPGSAKGYPALITVRGLPAGKELFSLAPFGETDSYGAPLAAIDLDGDGKDELVLGEGSGPGRPPVVRVCRLDGEIIWEWKLESDE